MATAHMLLSELEIANNTSEEPLKAPKLGVSVVMPKGNREPKPDLLIQAKLPLDMPEEIPLVYPIHVPVEIPVVETTMEQAPISESIPTLNGTTIAEMNSGWLFDTSTEIPTLALQQKKNEFEEINQLMQSIHSMPVLNEKLRANQMEVGTLLNNEPIKELKKGIGINDRFLFVQELFRGDEIMYERSIKTIDSFAIYPEAQFWIQRELKLKVGWNDDSATVKHFDQLVKRRFS
jgi:hypothetical protein